jgi:hypothetical protein
MWFLSNKHLKSLNQRSPVSGPRESSFLRFAAPRRYVIVD